MGLYKILYNMWATWVKRVTCFCILVLKIASKILKSLATIVTKHLVESCWGGKVFGYASQWALYASPLSNGVLPLTSEKTHWKRWTWPSLFFFVFNSFDKSSHEIVSFGCCCISNGIVTWETLVYLHFYEICVLKVKHQRLPI